MDCHGLCGIEQDGVEQSQMEMAWPRARALQSLSYLGFKR